MDNVKYPDLMNRIYKLIITRQANSEGLILNNFTVGKLWHKKDKEDTDIYLLTAIQLTNIRYRKINEIFNSIDEVYNFINENWGVIE